MELTNFQHAFACFKPLSTHNFSISTITLKFQLFKQNNREKASEKQFENILMLECIIYHQWSKLRFEKIWKIPIFFLLIDLLI